MNINKLPNFCSKVEKIQVWCLIIKIISKFVSKRKSNNKFFLYAFFTAPKIPEEKENFQTQKNCNFVILWIKILKIVKIIIFKVLRKVVKICIRHFYWKYFWKLGQWVVSECKIIHRFQICKQNQSRLHSSW